MLSANYTRMSAYFLWTRCLPLVTQISCDSSSDGIMDAPNGKKRGLEHLDEYEPKPAKHLRSLHDRMAERRLVVILEGASLETVKVNHQGCICVLLSNSPYLLNLEVPPVSLANKCKKWLTNYFITPCCLHFVCFPGWKIIWIVELWPTQKHDREKRKESGQHKTRYHPSGKHFRIVSVLHLC